MPKISQDEIVTQAMLRFFYQVGGAQPGNRILYGGLDGQFMNIESASNPVRSIEAINVQDPKRSGRFVRIGRNKSATDYPTGSVQFLQAREFLPPQFGKLRTNVTTFYQLAGDTADLTDFVSGWNHYVKVYSSGEVTEPDEGGGSWDSGEQIQDDMPYTWESVYAIGSLIFSEKASVEVYSEIVDLAYGTLGDGTQAIYALAKNTVASPGQAPSLFYRTREDGSWTEIAITGSVSTDVPMACAVLGSYLMVVFDNGTTGGYFYAEINAKSGVPGAFTKVTTGFVTGKAPQDIFAPSSRTAFFCGKGGYIYRLKSVPTGVSVSDAGVVTTQQLNRISGTTRGTMVIVGAADTIVFTTNFGAAWNSAQNVTGSGAALTAVGVVSPDVWWVGTTSGGLYYTTDQANSAWSTLTLGVTPIAIQDIVWATNEVGFILLTTSGPAAVLYTTWNGGEDWTRSNPRIVSTPTADRFNRLALPEETDSTILSNYPAIGGLAGNGSDGVIYVITPRTF